MKQNNELLPNCVQYAKALNEQQIQWERDVALSQLKQLNIELGEKPYLKAVSIEWLKKHGTHLVTMPERKFDSSNMAFLFTLIKDWEDENGKENN